VIGIYLAPPWTFVGHRFRDLAYPVYTYIYGSNQPYQCAVRFSPLIFQDPLNDDGTKLRLSASGSVYIRDTTKEDEVIAQYVEKMQKKEKKLDSPGNKYITTI